MAILSWNTTNSAEVDVMTMQSGHRGQLKEKPVLDIHSCTDRSGASDIICHTPVPKIPCSDFPQTTPNVSHAVGWQLLPFLSKFHSKCRSSEKNIRTASLDLIHANKCSVRCQFRPLGSPRNVKERLTANVNLEKRCPCLVHSQSKHFHWTQNQAQIPSPASGACVNPLLKSLMSVLDLSL